MSNTGLRVVIDRRDDRYWWTITDLGEQFEANRGYETIVRAAEERNNTGAR